MDREKILKQWDNWREYIANGGKASWPRDAFEAMLDYFEEENIKICPVCKGTGYLIVTAPKSINKRSNYGTSNLR